MEENLQQANMENTRENFRKLCMRRVMALKQTKLIGYVAVIYTFIQILRYLYTSCTIFYWQLIAILLFATK